MLLLSCKNEKQLAFEPITITHKECNNCSSVSVNIPKAMGKSKLSTTINTAIKERIIAWLNFDEKSNAVDIDAAINSFTSDYKALVVKYPEESLPWEATIEGNITFENDTVLTIKLNSYLFTGGAHGLSTLSYLNFDKTNGSELTLKELFNAKDDFTLFAENAFRKQENIPGQAGINSTGFMFEKELFYLPDNIGYTEEGLLLFYEPYEIASYADGPISLTIPYSKANKYLKFPIQP